VLQSGGEEGMWTFDRYQRWMDQVSDWVRPAQTAVVHPREQRTAVFDVSTHGPAVKPVPIQPAPTKPTPARSGMIDEVIDVPSEDIDLAELAELAKKVMERKPSGSK
jgi:hypothetical protein